MPLIRLDHVNRSVYYHRATSTDAPYFTIKVYDEEYDPDVFYYDLAGLGDDWN